MASPCVVVASGGVPVTESPNGTPFTPTTSGFPVTIVANGGLPVLFIDVDGTLMPGGGAGGDTTAPALSSPTGTQTGQTTATIGVTTDEANGTLYSFVSTSPTPPSGSTLKAGTGAVFANSQSITTTGAKTASATGLTAATTYYAHWLHSDAAGNDSTIATSASFTTAAGGAFAPTDETGLYYWFDASNAASRTIATGVSQLNDLSGNARHAVQATGANQPTVATASQNGLDGLLFDSTDQLIAPDHAVTFIHAFVVAKNISQTSNRHLLRKGYAAGGYTIRFSTVTNAQFVCRNQAGTTSSTLNLTVPTTTCLLEASWDGTTMSFSVNGGTPVTQAFSGTSIFDNSEGVGVGSTSFPGTAESINSNWYEGFAYDSVKNSTIAENARSYLTTKWGL